MLNQRLHTNYSGNSRKNQARDSTHQCSGIVLLEDHELTDSEVLRFIMNSVEDIWTTQCILQHEIKKTNQSVEQIREILYYFDAATDLSRIENILEQILEVLNKQSEAINDDDRWPPGRSPKKSKKGGSYVRIQP